MGTDALIEVRSARDENTGSPVYGNCTLSLGDGSVKVQFENGRALVKRPVADLLRNNGGIEIPAFGIYRSPGVSAPMKTQAAGDDLQGDVDQADVDDLVEQLPAEEKVGMLGKLLGSLGVDAELAAQVGAAVLDAQGAKTDGEKVEDVPSADPPKETDEERRLRESAEEVARLEAEGELEADGKGDDSGSGGDGSKGPADALRVIPTGFDDKTQEGELRCLAKKGDGKQCANAAKDGESSCHLPAHAKQFAS